MKRRLLVKPKQEHVIDLMSSPSRLLGKRKQEHVIGVMSSPSRFVDKRLLVKPKQDDAVVLDETTRNDIKVSTIIQHNLTTFN